MNLLQKKNIEFTGQKRSSLDMTRGRIMLLSMFFILAYIIIGARIVDLTLIQGDLKKGEEKISLLEQKPAGKKAAMRADIVDRNGVILARSLKTASLYADPKDVSDTKTLAKELVKIFPDLSYGDTLKKLQSDKLFVWSKRNITQQKQHKMLDM